MTYFNLPLACPGKVFFGSYPDMEDLLVLKKENIQIIWNLMMELPSVLMREKQFYTNVLHSPIKDFNAPKSGSNFVYNLEQICLKLEAGHNVFIHCLGGHGRTGMALAALLIKINLMSADDALELTHNICNGPEMECQKDFIKKFYTYEK